VSSGADRPGAGVALTRRRLLLAGGGVVAAGVAGSAAWGTASWPVRRALGLNPAPFIPDADEGRVRLETVSSEAMGSDVSLFTAVPAGHGDGEGLPVVVVLHGSSASAAAFRDFGFGRFVTAAVERGAPPFVLAGTDDGPAGWVPAPGADPVTMLREELPGWLAERGHDARRRAAWGWSRGGYGALRLAQLDPGWAKAWALFSPAVSANDPALRDLSTLDRAPLGVWCGTNDDFYDDVRAVVDRLPTPPEITTYASGAHTRVFWNAHTLEALQWLSGKL
jgi:poly(3-hydroxybutyrate) depolymerase